MAMPLDNPLSTSNFRAISFTFYYRAEHVLWAISLHWITSGCSRKGNLLYLRVNVPWFFTKTGIFPLCSDNDLRWKIRSKKSIWIMQNDFLVNTQWSQGNSRTCCQDRGEKQEKKGKWKISVSLWFFGNIIDQMASPGHFMWKIRYPEATWLEK